MKGRRIAARPKEGMMELIVKRFEELSAQELFEIYKLRVSVFVVEQNCPYQEVDDADKRAVHVWLQDENGIAAYLRVLEPGAVFPECAIGRVIAVRRRCGLGTRIVSEGIRAAQTYYGAREIRIEAQTYARGLYEKLGSGRPRRSFWRTASRTSECSGAKMRDMIKRSKICACNLEKSVISSFLAF